MKSIININKKLTRSKFRINRPYLLSPPKRKRSFSNLSVNLNNKLRIKSKNFLDFSDHNYEINDKQNDEDFIFKNENKEIYRQIISGNYIMNIELLIESIKDIIKCQLCNSNLILFERGRRENRRKRLYTWWFCF